MTTDCGRWMNDAMTKWETADGVEFLKKVGLKSGQTVLDFGCSVGHYTIPAAKVVGNTGIVYTVDKEQQALDELQQKFETRWPVFRSSKAYIIPIGLSKCAF